MAPRPIAALGYPAYRRMWFGSIVSNSGNMMHVAAVGWVMATLSDSPLKITAVAFASMAPLFVLSPVAGALADRFPRRRMLAIFTIAQVLVALCITALSSADKLSFPVLVVFGALGGTGGAMAAPCFQAIMPTLVPKPIVRNAVLLTSTNFNISRAFGPMIAGVLIDVTGTTTVFAINAASYGAVLIALVGLPAMPPVNAVNDRSIYGDIMAGARYVRGMPGLRMALATVGIAAMSAGSLQFLIPIYARQALDVGATKYGILLSSFGIASIVAGIGLLVFDRGITYSRLVGFGLGMTSLGMIGVGLAPSMVLASAAVAVCGMAHLINTSSLNSSMQDQLDDRVRGRVMSLWLMVFGGAAPLAVLVQGGVAELVGIRAVIIANGVLVAAYLVFAHITRRLHRLDAAPELVIDPVGPSLTAVADEPTDAGPPEHEPAGNTKPPVPTAG